MKKIIASSMSEAMKKIRDELGHDAVILNSKVIYTGGFLGLFKSKQIEVVAGVDPREMPISQRVQKEEMNTSQDQEASVQLKNEINELKEMMSVMSKQRISPASTAHFPTVIETVLDWWREQDFEEEWILMLGDYLLQEWKKNPSDDQLQEWAKKWLKIQIENMTHRGIEHDKKYINVIGPTGVGKTTTIAKIAAKLVVEGRKKVAFITTDTYRIAAIEQLKIYAQLLNVPLEVVYKRSDFEKAIEKFEDYDHVFIDTAGRNYRDQQYVEELKRVIDFNENMQSFLVLSMTSKKRDMQMIVDQFHSIEINRFIFTKWDESITVGPIFHLMQHNDKGAAYLTTGQAVPEDIIEASPLSVYKLLTEGVKT
ncbi:flagellar biosynthesis protein FlhF [Jeotgalibacillus soli]